MAFKVPLNIRTHTATGVYWIEGPVPSKANPSKEVFAVVGEGEVGELRDGERGLGMRTVAEFEFDHSAIIFLNALAAASYVESMS